MKALKWCNSFTALLFGLGMAFLFPQGAVYIEWIGQIFVSLIKVLILPIVLVSCYLAISSLGSSREFANLGKRTFLYYLTTSVFAAGIGVFSSYLFLPESMNIEGLPQAEVKGVHFQLEAFIAKFIPTNLFQSLLEGNLLHLVFIAVATGVFAQQIKKKHRENLNQIALSLNQVLMRMIQVCINLAPLGVFALTYAALSQMNFEEIAQFKYFIYAVSLAALFHAVIFLPILLAVLGKVSIFAFFPKVSKAIWLALSTASSSASYPVSKSVLETNFHVKKKVTSFTLPIGATLNMDGSALYQSTLLIFMAKFAGIDLAVSDVLLVFALTMASSAGTAGVPGGGLGMMSMMMGMIGIPVEYIGLYLLVDRFFDYPITAINVWGDLVGAKIMDEQTPG